MSGASILGALLAALPDAVAQNVADKIIDQAEDLIKKTPTKIDDILVLPLIKKARKVFNIPDNDEAEA